MGKNRGIEFSLKNDDEIFQFLWRNGELSYCKERLEWVKKSWDCLKYEVRKNMFSVQYPEIHKELKDAATELQQQEKQIQDLSAKMNLMNDELREIINDLWNTRSICKSKKIAAIREKLLKIQKGLADNTIK